MKRLSFSCHLRIHSTKAEKQEHKIIVLPSFIHSLRGFVQKEAAAVRNNQEREILSQYVIKPEKKGKLGERNKANTCHDL